jgi:hypothetical protein
LYAAQISSEAILTWIASIGSGTLHLYKLSTDLKRDRGQS